MIKTPRRTFPNIMSSGAILVILTLCVIQTQSLSAQDLSGLSFCIDPGHGLGNTNQGPTGLREADINLTVSFFLRDFLNAANMDTVILTRIDDSTNPSLSQREALANSFGVDWFHSVHHNALNGMRRFTLLLYEEERTFADPCPGGSPRGTGMAEWRGLADIMSQNMALRIFQALRTSSFTDRLDWSFFGGCNGGFNLGVLNDLIMPGQLSEATFHDNAIEERKLRNPDFLKLEARALFMSFLDFFDAGQMQTGTLAGIVTDEDSGQPVNGATVTLVPGGQTYTTDDHGNGLYVFHDLSAGDYSVTAAKEGFDAVTATEQVERHAFAFADLQFPSTTPPVVVQTLPENGAFEVDVYTEIGARFSRAMDRQSVEDAFVIGPAVDGKFIWSDASDVLLFQPDTRFRFQTEYTARIAGDAMDEFGRRLDGDNDGQGGDAFLWEFITETRDDSRPVVLDFSPTQRDTGVFVREVLRVQFNRDLDQATVNNENVILSTAGVPQLPLIVSYEPEIRTIFAAPVTPLPAESRLFLNLSTAISLTDGARLEAPFRWQFESQAQPPDFEIWDDFEAGLAWNGPGESPRSFQIEPDSTSFIPSSVHAITDTTAAMLQYQFLADSGLAHIERLEPVNIDTNDVIDVGFYVYGDGSGNSVRLFLLDSDGEEALPWVKIDWLGWQLLRFGLSENILEPLAGGNGRFDSAELTVGGLQLSRTGEATGMLFFEDFFLTRPQLPVFVEDTAPAAIAPKQFSLNQNYPNPFNPGTTIVYEILSAQQSLETVTLSIFNLNGQLVKTLERTQKPPGQYRVIWDGRDEAGVPMPNGRLHISTARRAPDRKQTHGAAAVIQTASGYRSKSGAADSIAGLTTYRRTNLS